MARRQSRSTGLYRHQQCGEVSQVDLRCVNCGEPMHADERPALRDSLSVELTERRVAAESINARSHGPAMLDE